MVGCGTMDTSFFVLRKVVVLTLVDDLVVTIYTVVLAAVVDLTVIFLVREITERAIVMKAVVVLTAAVPAAVLTVAAEFLTAETAMPTAVLAVATECLRAVPAAVLAVIAEYVAGIIAAVSTAVVFLAATVPPPPPPPLPPLAAEVAVIVAADAVFGFATGAVAKLLGPNAVDAFMEEVGVIIKDGAIAFEKPERLLPVAGEIIDAPAEQTNGKTTV